MKGKQQHLALYRFSIVHHTTTALSSDGAVVVCCGNVESAVVVWSMMEEYVSIVCFKSMRLQLTQSYCPNYNHTTSIQFDSIIFWLFNFGSTGTPCRDLWIRPWSLSSLPCPIVAVWVVETEAIAHPIHVLCSVWCRG